MLYICILSNKFYLNQATSVSHILYNWVSTEELTKSPVQYWFIFGHNSNYTEANGLIKKVD
jgi:hypothetical protein